jgi:hypothetical protein
MSWIEKEEKLLTIQQNYTREVADSIKCYFLYMNRNLYIEQITTEDIAVIDGKISKERVLRLVQEKRFQKTNFKYTFKDAWMFLVDLEPSQVQAFSQSEVSAQFITPLPLLEDIIISPSIFIFHDMNAVYFLFEEVPAETCIPPKPVLRKDRGCDSHKNKITKKVTYSKFNKTRKNISI